MRLWTIQGIEIYNRLQSDGIAYCTVPAWSHDQAFMRAYRWMAAQMRQRIGQPPAAGIEFPIWAWYQYNCRKDPKPRRNQCNVPEGLSALMELDVPDADVLLSDFNLWLAPLNEAPLDDWKHIGKEVDRMEKDAGRLLRMDELPADLQHRIEKSWEPVFDLDLRVKGISRTHRRNRSIQATLWALLPEYIISAEVLERKDNVIRTISLYNRNIVSPNKQKKL